MSELVSRMNQDAIRNIREERWIEWIHRDFDVREVCGALVAVFVNHHRAFETSYSLQVPRVRAFMGHDDHILRWIVAHIPVLYQPAVAARSKWLEGRVRFAVHCYHVGQHGYPAWRRWLTSASPCSRARGVAICCTCEQGVRLESRYLTLG